MHMMNSMAGGVMMTSESEAMRSKRTMIPARCRGVVAVNSAYGSSGTDHAVTGEAAAVEVDAELTSAFAIVIPTSTSSDSARFDTARIARLAAGDADAADGCVVTGEVGAFVTSDGPHRPNDDLDRRDVEDAAAAAAVSCGPTRIVDDRAAAGVSVPVVFGFLLTRSSSSTAAPSSIDRGAYVYVNVGRYDIALVFPR
jgi:hypothetical protein